MEQFDRPIIGMGPANPSYEECPLNDTRAQYEE